MYLGSGENTSIKPVIYVFGKVLIASLRVCYASEKNNLSLQHKLCYHVAKVHAKIETANNLLG